MTRRLAPLLQARPRLLLVLLCLAFWLPGFFTLPPTDRDESRFTQATKQMLETGDFVRIMNGSVPRNRKPIGIHWLQAPFAAAARGAGIATENPVWPYRIPSLLGGIAAVLATYSLGLTLFARRDTALAAAALLAGCVVLTVEAHIAKTDAALVGVTTIAMAVLARAFMGLPLGRAACALFWVAMGAGILIKGPVTPMVVGLAALCASLAWRGKPEPSAPHGAPEPPAPRAAPQPLASGGAPEPQAPRSAPEPRVPRSAPEPQASRSAPGGWAWLGRLRPRWGLPLTLLVVAPWFAAIGLATHGAFFADAVGGDLGRKLAGGEESHGGFPGTHLLLLPLLAFPATLPVLCGLRAAWRHRQARATLFLLAWLLPNWLVFEAVPTKLPHYTLPLYPALMLLAGAWLTEAGRPATPAWLRRAAAALAALAAALIGIGALAIPLLLHAPFWLGLPALLCAAAAGWCAARATSPAAAASAALATGLLYGCVLGLDLPALSPLWIAPRAEAALRRYWPADSATGAGLVAAGYAEPSLMFLAGTDLTLLPNGPGGADALARDPAGAVLVTTPDIPGFLAEAEKRHIAPRAMTTIEGFNYSRGVRTGLTLFLAGPPPAR
jgi:4-amino-4-deoxy-L-arabinose transferase-like glycosyltransferase